MSLLQRRMLMDSGESKLMYSGTYAVTERTYDDVYFNCPGATHFAIMLRNEPDFSTGNAFFSSIMSNQSRNIFSYSNISGASASMGMNTTNPHAANLPVIEYVETGVKMIAETKESSMRWFQPGTYDWCAW